MEDNFSTDGGSGGMVQAVKQVMGQAVMRVMGSAGERQMKFHSLACHSPPAVQPSS